MHYWHTRAHCLHSQRIEPQTPVLGASGYIVALPCGPTSVARAAAQRVYDTTKGRKRKERLQRARTDLLHVWRESLLPGAGSGAGRAPGRLAAIVDELAEVVLQLYRRQRELFISEVCGRCAGCMHARVLIS